MSERPTPETDALILSKTGFGPTDWEWRVHARRLERERDEAREKYDLEATEHMLAVNKLCGERDEARNQRDILRLDAQKEDIHHDRMIGELERVYAERDAAQADAKSLAERLTLLELESTDELARMERLCHAARETDACTYPASAFGGSDTPVVHRDLALKLEAERDDLRLTARWLYSRLSIFLDPSKYKGTAGRLKAIAEKEPWITEPPYAS